MSSWAKADTKPTYTANEISGLDTYISGQIQDTDTQYTLVKVTDYQYKLMSRKKGEAEYATQVAIVDIPDPTTDINALKDAIGTGTVASQIKTAIDALDVESVKAGTGEIISTVGQTNGKISVVKRALTADDIPTIGQSQVSGLTGALAAKQDALSFQSPYEATTNKAATMADVNSAVAGLSGAMHFKGVVTAVPPVTGTYAAGDVVLSGNKEYVYDGSKWHELGDETIYAVKGSIVNADIAANAAIDKSKIAGLGALASLSKVAEANLDTALATKIDGKANTSALNQIAFDGEVSHLKQTGTVLVLNCGSSTVNV